MTELLPTEEDELDAMLGNVSMMGPLGAPAPMMGAASAQPQAHHLISRPG
jgi:hypothetical protein